MRILWGIVITEEHTSVFGFKISNRLLCFIFGISQGLIVFVSFLQHVYSYITFKHVFFCRSDIAQNATWDEKFLAYDIVIYDFGLMHRILGTTECVANYLDGGYMRCAWTVEQTSALLFMVVAITCMKRPIWLLWPALFMQSSYALGMAVLTMATTPKILEALSGHVDQDLAVAFCIYVSGVVFNWLFAFVLWHHYWGEEIQVKNEKHAKQEEAVQLSKTSVV